MTPRAVVRAIGAKVLPAAKRDRPNAGDFWSDAPEDAEAARRNPLARFFWENTGSAIDKWHHYFDIYERHLRAHRGTDVHLLEIGVQNGGSARMLRDYLGPDAVIWGVDIDPACARHDGVAGPVRIGSQADAAFMRSVAAEMGRIDVVIDDGSHDSRHVQAAFETLFPLLSEGGAYIVEDMHAAYWPSFSGGYRAPESFVEWSKAMIDDMHHWYHSFGVRREVTRDLLSGLHFYDSIIVFDKARVSRPRRTVVPS